MRKAPEITMQWINKADAQAEPKSEIFFRGQATKKYVSGACLEAAIQWEKFYLLFTTDDCPFEEALSIILLDEKLRRVDSAGMGMIYSTGIFSLTGFIEPNVVEFEFFGDTRWTVELLPKSMFRIPFFGEPVGVWRWFGFSRHFIIRGNPQPMEQR